MARASALYNYNVQQIVTMATKQITILQIKVDQ